MANPDDIKTKLLTDESFLDDIYNNFDPFTPLPAHHPAYCECHQVRGDENIIQEIGKKITRSNQSTCQLYTGHRGGGKSTELYRLKDYLENKGCFVIYFNSDEDLDLENIRYTDILLSCTRHIVDELQNDVKPNALIKWLMDRGQELKSFGLSEVEINELSLEQKITPWSKIVANIKISPENRQKIRKQLEENIVTFNQALNEFINEAKKKLPDQKTKLVVIVDNLDRIPIQKYEDGSNNHDEIFIDHNVQLKNLQCHLVYTVPISLVYSNRATSLREHYGDTEVLPMIMIQNKQEQPQQDGIDKLKELIELRIKFVADGFIKKKYPKNQATIELSVNDNIFDHEDTLNLLCKMTGGHVREVMFLVQESINMIDQLPITRTAVERAIAISRNTYSQTVDHPDWEKLARVARDKKIINDDQYRQLLFSRCVLEYRDQKTQKPWHDVHPLIKETDEFKESERNLKDNGQSN